MTFGLVDADEDDADTRTHKNMKYCSIVEPRASYIITLGCRASKNCKLFCVFANGDFVARPMIKSSWMEKY